MDDEPDDISAKRDRSPPFPYLGLSASIELTRKLYQVARTSEVRLAQVASHWNSTPTSGALPRYAGALQAYGLIESSGSNDSRKIRITDSGRRILEDTRPGVADELRAAAALRPKLFDELYRVWGRTRPADDIAKSALQFDYNFTQVAAKRFLLVFDEAVKCLPAEEIATGEVVEADAELSAMPIIFEPAEKRPSATIAPTISQLPASIDAGARRDVFALDEGEVTLIMPRSLSRTSFEDFVSWIDLVKRKVERTIRD